MPEPTSLTSWQQRLAEELVDDDIEISGNPAFQNLVLEELDHSRRARFFEARPSSYGAMILPTGESHEKRRAVRDHIAFDVVALDGDPMQTRLYADGRSTYFLRDIEGGVALACFEQSMIFEVDLVHLQELTGAAIVQRTPVLDVVRLFVDGAVISWDGRHWQSRPTASSLCDVLSIGDPQLDRTLADVSELAVHWLAPSRVGATIVVSHDDLDTDALDITTATRTPALSMSNRRHFAAIVAVLRQHDLAVIVDSDGLIRKVEVGLRWTDRAEAATDNVRGMRHRSAQRYSHDQHDVTVVVVSEDGPVTIYRAGDALATTSPHDHFESTS